MPSLRNSLIDLDPARYERVTPAPRAPQPPPRFQPIAPEPPIGIRRSPVMLSSLPLISTNVDGVIRQFYGGANVPTRRLVNSG